VHDAAPLRFPPKGISGIPRRLYASTFFSIVGWRASAVITDSQFSCHEISTLSSIRRDDLTSIPLAIDPAFIALADAAVAHGRTQAETQPPFVLYVGTNKPWKNLEVAVRGADLAARSIPGLGLVIAGKQAANQESLNDLMARLSPSLPVRIVGTVSDAELTVLYRDAMAVLCPSTYEGFGLTGLEAMACGAPVVHSGAASLPEVLGDAALRADPHSPSEWASAIGLIAHDQTLREKLSRAGRERVRTFSVERMIEETVQVYRRVAARSIASS
jgi:glycosyltransferase involved in cell wall biosynthesis